MESGAGTWWHPVVASRGKKCIDLNAALDLRRLSANSMLSAVRCQTAGAGSSEESEHRCLYEKRVPEKMATLRYASKLSLQHTTARFG